MIPWYEKAVFYHIYPLGLCNVPKQNDGAYEGHHFDKLKQWADHVKKLGCNAIYIGPLFESVGHGYETTDYKLVDRRLGTNEEFADYVRACHEKGIRVIVDGVFNHTGREFFAFRDIQQNRENSRYKDWYCNVNFWGNNEYDDHFSYDNWGGYNLLVKLNQRNPEVKDYIYDVIRFWVKEFDIDGIRLDAADVLDFDFMKGIRAVANEVKPDFWLMGEVIHGDYGRWANGDMLHSVTNYELHKGLYSGHNDHNYFEIAHTVQRLQGLVGNVKLYTFVDNHDVARIYSKLNNKAHLYPVTLLLYGLPGVPSIYYGSEFAIEGEKQKFSDDNLRPCLELADYEHCYQDNEITQLIMKLGRIHQQYPELSVGRYQQLHLNNRQFAFARVKDDTNTAVVVAVNNDDHPSDLWVQLPISANRAVDLLLMQEKTKEELAAKEEREEQLRAGQAEKRKEELVLLTGEMLAKAEKIRTQAQQAEHMAVQLEDPEKLAAQAKELIASARELIDLSGRLSEDENAAESGAGIFGAVDEGCKVTLENGSIHFVMPPNKGTMIYLYNE